MEAHEKQQELVRRVQGVPVVLLERQDIEERHLLGVLKHPRERVLVQQPVSTAVVVVAVARSRTQVPKFPPPRRMLDVCPGAAS